MIEEAGNIVSLVSNAINIMKFLSNNSDELSKKCDLALEKLNAQNLLLERIEQKIDNQILRTAHKSIVHLSDAFRSRNELARKNSLFAAYKGFTELICLDSTGKTTGTSCAISNKDLIGLGYYGRFVYYCLLECYSDALTQIYEFTSMFPEIGVKAFDAQFFCEDYEEILSKIDSRINVIQGNLNSENRILSSTYDDIPDNQMLPLLEMEKESTIQEIVDECGYTLKYLKKMES